jgi:hypothetical protein
MAKQLTVVIHGTFANNEEWWKLTDGSTFADRLETALAARSMPGTVWKPAFNAVRKNGQHFSYHDFAWSGRNRHKDRIQGGEKIAATLMELADSLGASEAEPLSVNFVAHSHGGNVVLEALKWVRPPVRVRQVILLGTPLIRFQPAFRLIRPVLTLLAGYILVRAGIDVLSEPDIHLAAIAAGALGFSLSVLFLGWFCVTFSWIIDLIWRVVSLPMLMWADKVEGQLYGPSPAFLLAKQSTMRRIISFASRIDEAGLLLRLGAAPYDLYEEICVPTGNLVKQFAELMLVRPTFLTWMLTFIELALARYVIGIPWRLILFYVHQVSNYKWGFAYPRKILRQIDVTEYLLPLARKRFDEQTNAMKTLLVEQNSGIKGDVQYVVRSIIEQINLRHAGYYQNAFIVDRIAHELAIPGDRLETRLAKRRRGKEICPERLHRRRWRLRRKHLLIYGSWFIRCLAGIILSISCFMLWTLLILMPMEEYLSSVIGFLYCLRAYHRHNLLKNNGIRSVFKSL